MERDYLLLAGPFFFLLMGLELWVSRRRGRDEFRLPDAISNVSTSMLMQLVMLLTKGAIVAGYFWVHGHFRMADLPADRAATWIACFLGVDFGYYWFHRLSHEVNFLWAAHVVHHQSEDYNLSVALRQSTLQPFFGAAFYWPLALIGFPPLVFLACASFNTIYQFWLHTRFIGTLGPLEAVLVTPSHHRVHHGRNPIYIDRNHGGTLILWDRLFGTFEREREPVVYGVTEPLASWNPVWANFHTWVELFRSASRTRRPLDKLRTFLKPPGWFPAERGGFQPPPPVGVGEARFDRPVSGGLAKYALLQFGILVAATVALSFLAGQVSFGAKLAGIAVVAWGFGNLGGLLDGRGWAFRSETLRVSAVPLLPFLVIPNGPAWGLAALLVLLVVGTVLFFVWCLPARRALGQGARGDAAPAGSPTASDAEAGAPLATGGGR